MKTPYFSVVIPTKGRSFLVGGAVESVLRQTFPDFEVVVVDNDDGDATRKVVEQFKDPRLRYHRTGNLSMPDNWEAACNQARGEYLLLVEDKQALKFRALERIHSEARRDSPEILRWLCDMWDDTTKLTFVDAQRGTGEARRLRPEEILEPLFRDGLGAVSRTIPIAHYSGFHRTLCDKIRRGPVGRLCPPVSPDYSIGFQALAYADSVLCFDEALVASSRLHSNGRSFVLKTGGVSQQFIADLKSGTSIFVDQVPVKALTVPGGIYNDLVRLSKAIGGRLTQFPFNWPNYFAETYQYIIGCQGYGVDMDDELAAWKDAFAQQSAELRGAVAAKLRRADGPRWKAELRRVTKQVRRKTGLYWLEQGFKDRLRQLTGRKLTGRFTNLLQYVEWEAEHVAARRQ